MSVKWILAIKTQLVLTLMVASSVRVTLALLEMDHIVKVYILLVLYNSYCMSWLHIIQCCMKLLPLGYIICVKAHRLLH